MLPPAPRSKRFDDLGLPYPELQVFRQWNEQGYARAPQPFTFPNPLALAEAMKTSGDYEAWSGGPATNIAGYSYTYGLSVNVPKQGEVQKATGLGGGLSIRRPDRTTLAAVTHFDDVSDMREAAVRVYDDAGEHPFVQVTLKRENDGAPLRVVEVRWDPDTGYERIWAVSRFGVVYRESIAQGGTEYTLHEDEALLDKRYDPPRSRGGVWVDSAPPESNEFELPIEVTLRKVLDMSHPDLPRDVLDFETGQVRVFPQDLPRAQEGFWCLQNGIDLMQDTGPDGVVLMTPTLNELRLVTVPGEMWSTTRGYYLRHALTNTEASGLPEYERGRQMNPDIRAFIVETNVGLPVTIAFQTGEGTMGVMELTRFGRRDQSLSLRYKLLKPDVEAVAAGLRNLNAQPDYMGANEVLGFVSQAAEKVRQALTEKNAQLGGKLVSDIHENVQLYNSLVAGTDKQIPRADIEALRSLTRQTPDDPARAIELAQSLAEKCRNLRRETATLSEEQGRAWKRLLDQRWRIEQLRPDKADASGIEAALKSLKEVARQFQIALNREDLASARVLATKLGECVKGYEEAARSQPDELARLKRMLPRLLDSVGAGNLVLAKSLNEVCETHCFALANRLARLEGPTEHEAHASRPTTAEPDSAN